MNNANNRTVRKMAQGRGSQDRAKYAYIVKVHYF